MLFRASVIWLALLGIAILNGTAREFIISPRTGAQTGHVLSTMLLSALIFGVAWFAIPWVAPETRGRALTVGVWWVVLTLAFEFLAGHYLFGNSWQKLFADYDIVRGRIWLLVPIITLLAPVWVQSLRAH